MAENQMAIVPVKTYAIAGLRDRIKIILKDNFPSGMERGDLERVTVPTGGGTQWEREGIDGTDRSDTLDGIILDMRDGRTYWQDSFDQSGGGAPPDCICEDLSNPIGIGTPGGDCTACQMAQFDGDQRPECRLQRILLMVTPGDNLPFILQLPVTSVKPCRQFMAKLFSRGASRFGTVISIGIERDKSSGGIAYSKATFLRKGMLDEEGEQTMRKIGQELRESFASQSIVDVKPDVAEQDIANPS